MSETTTEDESMDRSKDAAYYREQAKKQYHEDGSIEIDDDAQLSDSGLKEPGGCYVAAWVWVDDKED